MMASVLKWSGWLFLAIALVPIIIMMTPWALDFGLWFDPTIFERDAADAATNPNYVNDKGPVPEALPIVLVTVPALVLAALLLTSSKVWQRVRQ